MKFLLSFAILVTLLGSLVESVEVRPLMPKPWPFNDPTFGKFFIPKELGNQIWIPNQKRTHGAAMLKLSILGGVTVTGNETLDSGAFGWKLSDGEEVKFTLEQTQDSKVMKQTVLLSGAKDSERKEICVHYGEKEHKWFAGYHSLSASWPMNPTRSVPRKDFSNIRNCSFTPTTEDHQLILEQLFISSQGFAILFDDSVPLFMRRDPNGPNGDALLCFSANNSGPYNPKIVDPAYKDLKMYIFSGENIRVVTDYVVAKSGLIGRPTQIPDERKFTYPTFSNYAQEPTYQQMGTRTQVLKLAEEIIANNFSAQSEIMIDDYLQREYGDITMNPNQFADARGMIDGLHKKGFRVGLGLTPAIKAFRTNMRHNDPNTADYFIRDIRDNDATVLVDFSNPEGATWFEYLMRKQHYENLIDTFQLSPTSAISWLLNFHDPEVHKHPGRITTKYVETGARLGRGVVSDVAYKTQHLPNFIRFTIGRYQTLFQEQLDNLIPNALAVSMAGYSWFLPNQIGGFSREVKPIEDHYIRWVQATALMPSMSFLYSPWSYRNQTVLDISQKFIKLHEEHAPLLIALAHKRVQTGSPIIRSLWYVAPNDPETWSIGDQFLVGDDLLVAPILKHDQFERNVYLPDGVWVDQHGAKFAGKTWITVKVPIDELAYFKRVIN